MKKKSIYIDVRHSNYWWGIYNFNKETSWEDIIVYQKEGNAFKKLASICICSSTYLQDGLDDLKNDEDEKEFVYKIEQFLKNNKIVYHYYYDKPGNDDFYEVPYEAERNSLNIKPSSIEVWYPCEGVDKGVIDKVVIEFSRKFLDIEVESVNYKDIVNKEEALESYIQFEIDMQKNTGMTFSEEVIQKASKILNVSEEKVMEIFRRSIK